ncbi:MAG: aldehyde dehydrogenase family protein, partial [Pseudomonadota bacterium]
MTDLLTHAEYQSIAAEIDLPKTPFIDGKYRRGTGPEMDTVNPATNDVIAQISTAGSDDVELAVQKAREAFDQGHWSKLHPSERKDVLIRMCKLMTRRGRELVVLESIESGKPVADIEQIDLPETIHCIKWHAEAVDKIYDQTGPNGDDAISMIVREPIGVVAAILPWNFPMLMMAWKIGPALAAGCSVIVKPAEQTSMTALRIAEIAHMAGVPRGVLQVLPGDGPSVGEPLGRHMDIDMVTFTGSTDTGRRFLTYAAESNLKKVTLECGGKNPAIVLSDAENLDSVAGHVVNAAFWNAGQNCSAASRLIVHQNVKEQLMDRILQRTREWRIGDPLDPATRIGTMVDSEHCAKVASYLKGDAVTGGTVNGNFISPTIYEVGTEDKRAV